MTMSVKIDKNDYNNHLAENKGKKKKKKKRKKKERNEENKQTKKPDGWIDMTVYIAPNTTQWMEKSFYKEAKRITIWTS